MNNNDLNTNPTNGLNNNVMPGAMPNPNPMPGATTNPTPMPNPTAPATPVAGPVPTAPMGQPTPTVSATPVAGPVPAMPVGPASPATPVAQNTPAAPMGQPTPIAPTTPVAGPAPTAPMGQPATPVAQSTPTEPTAAATPTADATAVPTDAPATEPEPKKKTSPVIIIILIIVILGAIGYGAYTLFFKDKKEEPTEEPKQTETCSVVSDYKGYISVGESNSVNIGDKTYNFKAENLELFNKAFSYSTNVDVNVCITGEDVTNYTLLKKVDGSAITATTESELRTALGLKAFGSYTAEKATLVEINLDNPGDGIDGEKTYKYYDVLLKFADGNEQTCKYVIYDTTKDNAKTLKTGTEYTVDYEVIEGVSEVEYRVTSIK